MTIIQLARLGFDDLLARALAGELAPANLWLAVEGGSRYAAAVARGDLATTPVAAARAARCSACPVRTERPMRAGGGSVGYCGEPFTERMESAVRSCGCLVTLSVEGETVAAGKTVVESEKCPNGFW